MRETNSEAKLKELLAYPEHYFGEPASERWLALCSSLSTYQPPAGNFVIQKERKWELVSALQKAIRRADKFTALQLISCIANMPEECGYFGRRICVIACEDIGPADDTLVKFVIACATIFSARSTGPENIKLLSFLAEQMCDLSIRSRIYCSYETVSIAAKKGALPRLEPGDEIILDFIVHKKKTVDLSNSCLYEWQKKNNWRTAGLLKYIGLSLPLESQVNADPVPAARFIFDLPSYCYDQYTRIGLAVLRRLVRGVHGAEAITDFFHRNRVTAPHKVLGEALFTVEGGREKSELVHPSLGL